MALRLGLPSLLLLLACLCHSSHGSAERVKIAQGTLTGTTYTSVGGRVIQAYLGIPYGEAPVGERRFLPPVKASAWTGTFNANRMVQCRQSPKMVHQPLVGVEDCLVVNVYTTSLKPASPAPVMVWIHGGGFFMGSGTPEFYGPELLMDQDIVLVTFNYRLGPLGFLSMGDDVLPGNAGLWDQNLALKWVQENIAAFGGDPNKVTLFGESAGSMSVFHHVMSPHSTGLFHAAIMQSGVCRDAPVCAVAKHPAYYARSLAAEVGCDPDADSVQIRKCLQKAPADALIENGFMFSNPGTWWPQVFFPVVDDFASKPFLPADPHDLIEKGSFNHVPIIIGANTDEGVLFTAEFIKNESRFDDLHQNWQNAILGIVLNREFDDVSESEKSISSYVLETLFKNQKPTADHNLDVFTRLFGTAVFNAPVAATAKKLAEKSKAPVFQYIFDHQGSFSFADILIKPQWKIGLRSLSRLIGLDLFNERHGVCHADDLFMLFKPQILPMQTLFTEEDRAASANVIKLWTDFAKVGNPTPSGTDLGVTWKRVDPSRPEVLTIRSQLSFGAPPDDRVASILEDIWRENPPRMRLSRSNTWKDAKMHRRRQHKGQTSKSEL